MHEFCINYISYYYYYRLRCSVEVAPNVVAPRRFYIHFRIVFLAPQRPHLLVLYGTAG